MNWKNKILQLFKVGDTVQPRHNNARYYYPDESNGGCAYKVDSTCTVGKILDNDKFVLVCDLTIDDAYVVYHLIKDWKNVN